MDIKPIRIPPRRPPVKPPQKPIEKPSVPPIAEAPASIAPPLPIEATDLATKKVRKRKKWLIIIASILSLGIIAAASGWIWYQVQLSPVDAHNTDKVQVNIASATTPNAIATLLEDKGVIRSATVFSWYTRLHGVQNKLQAGAYKLSPSESTPEIVDHLVNGSVGTFEITFYPGATLVDKVSKPENRIDVTTVLERAGYSDDEITAALNKKYDHQLFQDKPVSADLEGYIFGETYQFNSGATVEDILNRTFDEFYKWVVQDNLVDAFKTHGLTLYQGITLASIVQRESGGDDKAQIAQVFYSRLAMNMPLGSDVTYQYIADKTGVTRDPNLDSPYNTRRYVGLPPGPIAVPGLSALQAVAKPAEGNYLYFLNGDDHVTYFAHTLDEHEANIANHCKVKCQII
jgi:UPF0755 protein